MRLSLTSEQEVLEGHLLYILRGQQEPCTQKASSAHKDESSVPPTVGHNLVMGHEIMANLLKKKKSRINRKYHSAHT